MQRYTSYLFLWNALHVSGGSSVHHQELKNCICSIGYFVRPFLLPEWQVAEKVWQSTRCCIYSFWAPDDGRGNRLKHAEHFTVINNLCKVASCCLYLKILHIILRVYIVPVFKTCNTTHDYMQVYTRYSTWRSRVFAAGHKISHAILKDKANGNQRSGYWTRLFFFLPMQGIVVSAAVNRPQQLSTTNFENDDMQSPVHLPNVEWLPKLTHVR